MTDLRARKLPWGIRFPPNGICMPCMPCTKISTTFCSHLQACNVFPTSLPGGSSCQLGESKKSWGNLLGRRARVRSKKTEPTWRCFWGTPFERVKPGGVERQVVESRQLRAPFCQDLELLQARAEGRGGRRGERTPLRDA